MSADFVGVQEESVMNFVGVQEGYDDIVFKLKKSVSKLIMDSVGVNNQQEAEEFQERLVKLTFLRVRLFWDGCGPIPDFVPDTEDSERRETLSALEFDLRYPTESHPADFTYQILFFQISC